MSTRLLSGPEGWAGSGRMAVTGRQKLHVDLAGDHLVRESADDRSDEGQSV